MQQREDHTFLAKFPAQTGWVFLPWSVCAIAQVGHLPCTPSSTTMVHLHDMNSEFERALLSQPTSNCSTGCRVQGFKTKGSIGDPTSSTGRNTKKLGGCRQDQYFMKLGEVSCFPGRSRETLPCYPCYHRGKMENGNMDSGKRGRAPQRIGGSKSWTQTLRRKKKLTF